MEKRDDVLSFFYSQDDLRLLLISDEQLKEYVRKKSCIFELVGIPYQPDFTNVKSREIIVGEGMQIREVLTLANIQNWRGSPQVRLIKRNTIVQSPRAKQGDSVVPNTEAFQQLKIESGDILILLMDKEW
jgi:hypothetical protein